MDPVSQGALGALAGVSVVHNRNVRRAALIGWTAGMLPDADVFISSQTDPLLNLEYHRHFSHALIVIPIGALVCALVFWLLTRRWGKWSFRTVYWVSLAGFATAGLLDACTSYGTRLYWPFSDQRVAWNIISIVDPIFTGGMLGALTIALIKKRTLWARGALIFVGAYLALGLVQRERTQNVQRQLAETRGHSSYTRATVKPSIGNQWLWRSVYQHGDRFYVDAIRTGLLTEPRVYEGEAVPVLTLPALREDLPETSVLVGDLERFNHFSDHYLAWHPDHADVIGDLRYAVLPDSVKPLWGIRINRDNPTQHAVFETFRNISPEERKTFLRMLRGKELP